MMQLMIANRTFSTWSLRAWLVLSYAKRPFETVVYYFDDDKSYQRLCAKSPTGRAPALAHNDLMIVDSLAIAEYMAETALYLWPEDEKQRAMARMICCYIHSEIANLARECPMNLSNKFDDFTAPESVLKELETLEKLMQPLLLDWTQNGEKDFLFIAPSILDAFLTPIAARCYTYDLPVGSHFSSYLQKLLNQEYMFGWLESARIEQTDEARTKTSNGRFGKGFTEIGSYPLLAQAISNRLES
ncbi:MAG: glutathione S-transferase [Alphaproteobacteria bacterium]